MFRLSLWRDNDEVQGKMTFDATLYPALGRMDSLMAGFLSSSEAKGMDELERDQRLCQISPFYWMETYGWIESSKVEGRDVEIVPFRLNTAQLILANRCAPYLMPPDWKRAKLIVLKSRKMGVSTFFAALDYWFMRNMNGCGVFVIADKNKHTENIYKMITLFWEKDELPGKPTGKTISRNKQGLFLSNRSMLEMDSGETKHPATSQTIHVLHCSENSKWPQIVDAETSLLNSVAREGFVWMVKESTACGINKWKTDCIAALEKKSSWDFIFLEWPDMTDCATTLTEHERETFMLTGEETEIMETFSLSLENIKFRREKIGEIGLAKFKQDFPLHAREPFDITTSTYFDPLRVEDRKHDIEFYRVWKEQGYDDAIDQFPMIAKEIKESSVGAESYLRDLGQKCRIPKRVEVAVVKDHVTFTPAETEKEDAGQVLMWCDPDRRRRYVVTVDPAEGISSDGYTSDHSVIEVFDCYGREQAAELAGVYDEEITARYAVLLARLYGDCMIAVEMNCKCGGAVLTYIKERYRYFNLYRRQIVSRSQTVTNDEGWRTTPGNKQSLCYVLKIHFKEGDCLLHSVNLLNEMANFIEEKGKLRAAVNHTDDRIMACAIALQIIDSTPGLRSLKASETEMRILGALPRYRVPLSVRHLSDTVPEMPTDTSRQPSHRFKQLSRY